MNGNNIENNSRRRRVDNGSQALESGINYEGRDKRDIRPLPKSFLQRVSEYTRSITFFDCMSFGLSIIGIVFGFSLASPLITLIFGIFLGFDIACVFLKNFVPNRDRVPAHFNP